MSWRQQPEVVRTLAAHDKRLWGKTEGESVQSVGTVLTRDHGEQLDLSAAASYKASRGAESPAVLAVGQRKAEVVGAIELQSLETAQR